MSAVIDALFKTMKFYVASKGSGARPPGMLGNLISSYQAGFRLFSQLVPASESSGSETGPAMDAVVVVVRSGTGLPFLHVQRDLYL